MTILHFANRGILATSLSKGIVPIAVARTPVRYVIAKDGSYLVEPSATLTKQSLSGLIKLGANVQINNAVDLDRTASCWAEMLPLKPAVDELADRALLEWSDISSTPRWSAQLRRLGATITGWRIDPAQQRVLALIEDAPFHALAQPLPPGWRAFVEQSPRFWVEHGYRHPLNISSETKEHVLVRHDRGWEHVAPLDPIERNAKFTVPSGTTPSSQARPISIPLAPRLIADSRPSTPTFWVLPGTGESVLRAWLQHTDDRLVRQLQVARLSTDVGVKIVLLANADADRAPLLLLDAVGYQQYLKLNNLFVPFGMRLSPALRRDVARRTYAPRNDNLVWLDADGARSIRSTTLAFNAFRPLIEMVHYQTPTAMVRTIEAPTPLFSISPLVVRDRPAPKIRPKPAVPVTPDIPVDDKPGLLETLFGWVKGAWQITSTATTVPPVSETKLPPEITVPPPPEIAEGAAGDWRDQANAVRSRIHSGNNTSLEALANLARTGLREQRFADAAWCWQQVLWQSDQRNSAASIGWVQCETLLANAGKTLAATNRNEWTVGQLAANVVRWSFGDEPWPVSADAALKHLVEHDNELSIKAAWLAHRALARHAGNDVLSLARTRDRFFARLLEHGLRLEVDVPAFLRSEDAERSERLAAVRDWLIKSQESAARWLGERTTGLSTERLFAGDRLERFGLARERINTVYYAHLMIGWGLATVGATNSAAELMEAASSRLPSNDLVHAWLAAAFRWRIGHAGHGGRAASRWSDELQSQWRHLSSTDRFAVDRLRQVSRILEPLDIIDAFELARTGGDSPMAQLANAPETELTSVIENLLRRTRPSAAARLPVLTQALRVAPYAGETLVRSLTDQLLLELEPFTGTKAQWEGVQVGLTAVATMQLPEVAQRLLSPCLDWCRQADEPTPGIDRTLAAAIPALQRLNLDSALSDIIAAIQRLLPASRTVSDRTVLVDQTRLALAGGWLDIGQDDPAMKVLDETRRLLFTQNDYSQRDRLELTIQYVQSLRYAPARVAIGRMDEIIQRLPAPTDAFATNAYYALSSLRLLDTMVRAAANDDLTLGMRVRRWLDAEEYAIRRRIQRDLNNLMETK